MTVEEWLGEENQLGIDIWNRKYRYNDETFDEWLDRVSAGDSKVKELIKEKKFLFGGRILSNRGTNVKCTYSNCFPRGTLVYTQDGYKQIECIKKGEYVLTHNDRFMPVNETMNRVYNGELSIIEGYNFNKIVCTSNHKFLTLNGWKCAKDLTKQDYIKYMYYDSSFQEYKEDLTKYVVCNKDEVIDEKNGKVRLGTRFVGGNNANGINYGNFINKEITVTKDLLYVIGRWLGDGSITNRKQNRYNSIFQIVFNEKEMDGLYKCKSILEEVFGIEINTTENTDQHTKILRVDNVFLCEFFNRNFGKGGENKFIPNKLLPYLDWLVGLFDADASVMNNGSIRISIKNELLLKQIKECLKLNGIPSSKIRKITNNKTFHIWTLEIPKNACAKIVSMLGKCYDDDRMSIQYNEDRRFKIVDDKMYVRVSNNTTVHTDELGENIQVFNLSVEEDNSYVVNDVIAHNCYVIDPPSDSIEGIFDCGKKLARTFSYGGGCGIDLSNLAPRGARVNNTAKVTSGAVSFTDLYSLITGLIGQNGRRKKLGIIH